MHAITLRPSIWDGGIEQPDDGRRWPAVIHVPAGEIVRTVSPEDIDTTSLRLRLIGELNRRADANEPPVLLIRMRDWYCLFPREDLQHVDQLYAWKSVAERLADLPVEDAATAPRPEKSVPPKPSRRIAFARRTVYH